MTGEAAQAGADGAGEEGARNPRLDGLRGLAILPVMLYHLTFFGFATTPVDRALTFLPSLGWTSVDLFFVLSGFLITGILRRARGGEGYFRSFYARRALRIFPLYYLVLLFFLVVIPATRIFGDPSVFWIDGGATETLWYWLYLENLHTAWTGRFHHHFLNLVWTLCIEEQFYLAWPLVVFACDRRRLVQVCVALLVGAPLLRLAMVLAGAPPLSILTFTLCRVDTLAAGSLLAVLWTEPAWRGRLKALGPRALAASAAVWLAVVLISKRLTAVAVPPGQVLSPEELGAQALAFTRSGWMQTLGYEADLAFYASLLVCTLAAAQGSRLARFTESGFLRAFGRYSYAMYLLHLFVGELARALYQPARTEWPFVLEQIVWWVVAGAAIYAVAWLSWHLLEAPLLRWKRHFPMAVPPGAAGPLPAASARE